MMRVLNKFCIYALIFTLSANSTFAVDIPDSMRQAMSTETVGMPSLLHLVVSMVLVIALIYATGWIYSKLNLVNRNNLKKFAQKELDTDRFTILQSMSLGQQRHIYSIEMNGKVLLVGSTPSQINLIKEFNKDDTIELKGQTKEFIENNINTEENKNNKSNTNIDEIYKKYKN